MAQPRKAAPRKPAARRLPPITVARFEAAGELIERLMDENASVFIQRGQEYRDRHRQATSRPLSAVEAAQIAAGIVTAGAGDGRSVEQVAHGLQTVELRAHDEPQAIEVLAVAGVATAPAFSRAVRRIVALIEMPADVFADAHAHGFLRDAVDQAARDLENVELTEARDRASAALEHFGKAAGAQGEGLGLLFRTVWQALQQAAATLIPTEAVSELSSSTPSAAATAGSPAPTSSTN